MCVLAWVCVSTCVCRHMCGCGCAVCKTFFIPFSVTLSHLLSNNVIDYKIVHINTIFYAIHFTLIDVSVNKKIEEVCFDEQKKSLGYFMEGCTTLPTDLTGQ